MDCYNSLKGSKAIVIDGENRTSYSIRKTIVKYSITYEGAVCLNRARTVLMGGGTKKFVFLYLQNYNNIAVYDLL